MKTSVATVAKSDQGGAEDGGDGKDVPAGIIEIVYEKNSKRIVLRQSGRY